MSAPGTVYRQHVVPRWVLWGLLAALVALGVWAQWRDPGERGNTGAASFAAGALVYALVWGIPIWVALITVWSVNRYGSITLDGEQLRVGRERVRVEDIERDSVLRAASRPPGRRAARADTYAASGKRPAGGSLALPTGVGAITVTLRDGREVVLQTRDRAGLLEALLSVVPATDDPQEPVLTEDGRRTRTLFRRAAWGPARLHAADGLTTVELPDASTIALSDRAPQDAAAGRAPDSTQATLLVDGRPCGGLRSLAALELAVEVDDLPFAAPGLRLHLHVISQGLSLRDDRGALVRPPTVRMMIANHLPFWRVARPTVADRARPEHVALWLAASWHLRDGR
ncbi:hypothetical protein ACHAAC_07710 [Aeromicrobium sp. CF4.19]|uniref:hypothetical protein n=1 Tax=Aeromicrobium sp. CF4.19 TaxID=3373082 RepID=UPI003EE4D3A0